LGVQKKKGLENRFFVLFKDRLDYFATEADEHEEPRGRLTLSEVDKLEVQGDGFSLILVGGQSLTLKTPPASLQPWLTALKPLLKAGDGGEKPKAKALCSGYLAVERKGQVKTPFFVLRQDSLERYEAAADLEKGQEPRAMPVSDIEKMTVKDFRLVMQVRDQKKPVELQIDSTKEQEFKQWARAFEKLLAKRLGANFVSDVSSAEGEPAGSDGGHASASVSGGTTPRDAPRVLCEGELLVLKKHKEEPRYAVLRTDCFEYYSNKEDYNSGAAARARALLDDVTSFEVLDGIMEVQLGDKKLSFKTLNAEDLRRWQTAWETDPSELPPVATQVSSSLSASATACALPKPRVVSSGTFTLREEGIEEGQAAPGMLLLREDRLEFFKGGEGNVDGQVPDVSARIEDIEDLEVHEDRFAVHLTGSSRNFELVSPQGKTMEEWYSELQQVFEEAESTANSTTSDKEKELKFHTEFDEDELKEITKDLVQAAKTVGVTLKTERILNGRKVESDKDLHEALQQADTAEILPDDFVGAMRGLGIGLTESQIECLLFSMDLSQAGGITLAELEKVIQVTEEVAMALAPKVREKKRAKLQEPIPTPPIASVRFEDLDKNQDGIISREEFEQFQKEMIEQAGTPSRSLPGEMEEENADNDQPSSPSRPARNRALVSGPVELDGEKRHGVLYADRLAFFQNSEDIVYADPVRSLQLREIKFVKVSQGLVEIEALTGLLKMRCRQAPESWQSCLAEVLEPTFTKQVKGKSVEWLNVREPTDSPVRLPKTGGSTKPMHQGPLKIVQEDGSEQMRYFLVYNDRFEHFTDAAKALRGSGSMSRGVVYAMDVTSVRVIESAFIFELRHESLHVQVPIGEDMEIWVSAFQLLFHPQNDASHTPSNVDELPVFIHKRSPFMKDGAHGPERRKIEATELATEVQEERIQHWLQTLPEKVVHWGLLGFQHQQRLVVRLSILFKDRLDSWSNASNASCGAKEDSRILMSSIRGLETISGGLILNLGGKKVGVHVGDNENLHQWSRALLSVLAPNKVERAVSPRIASPDARSRSQTPTPRTTPRKGRDWVPEVAFKSTKSQTGGKSGASQSGQKRVTVLHRGVSLDHGHLVKAHQPEKRFYVHTHKGGGEAVETLHGKFGKFLPASHHVGSSHVRSEIASKPYARSESNSAISTRSTSREERFASKVTGEERQISPRRGADHSFSFWKINTEEAAVTRANQRSQTPPPPAIQGSRLRSRTPPDEVNLTGKIGSDSYQSLRSRETASSEHGVCGKVGGANRQPLQTPRRAKSQNPLVGKVTDAGREQNGWHSRRVSLADKVKSMAQTG